MSSVGAWFGLSEAAVWTAVIGWDGLAAVVEVGGWLWVSRVGAPAFECEVVVRAWRRARVFGANMGSFGYRLVACMRSEARVAEERLDRYCVR